jgi:predicted RNase H-like HicB family nuclease
MGGTNIMDYSVIIEKAENNYSAYAEHLPGCVATGQTAEEAKQRITEAIQWHLAGIMEDSHTKPLLHDQSVQIKSKFIAEEHWSPDGLLRLIVTYFDDGDTAIGFDGFSWHTHGDILARLSGKSEDQAIREFVNLIIKDNQIIGITRVNGEIRDIFPTDDPGKAFRNKTPEEQLEFRRWSGQVVPVAAPDHP